MEEHAKTNDDIILELRDKIDKKRNNLKNLRRFSPITNCIIELDKKNHNIRVMNENDLMILLIKLNSYKISYIDLSLAESCLFSGFSLDDWISDIRQKLDYINKKNEQEKLKKMENKLKALLTNEKKVQLEVEELKNLLEGM